MNIHFLLKETYLKNYRIYLYINFSLKH